MKRVVITGIGIVSCLGNNQEEVYQSLLNSKSGISYSEEYKEYNLKSNIHGKPNIKLEEIKMCIGYELDGKKLDYLPATSEDQFNIKPIYQTFPGWKSSTQGIRNIEELPEKAKKYIHALEDFIGCKVSSISTSPEREDTILIEDPFKA